MASFADVGGSGDASNGFKDGGSIQLDGDPKVKSTGVYYVTEKFVDSPTLQAGDYTGMMIIQGDIDEDNGKLIIYFTREGIFTRTKYTGGWGQWIQDKA